MAKSEILRYEHRLSGLEVRIRLEHLGFSMRDITRMARIRAKDKT